MNYALVGCLKKELEIQRIRKVNTFKQNEDFQLTDYDFMYYSTTEKKIEKNGYRDFWVVFSSYRGRFL